MTYHEKHDRRVFVLEQVKRNIDLSTARDFGTLTRVFGPDDRRAGLFDVENFVDDVVAALKRKEFSPERDYFCVAGGTVSMSLAFVALARVADQINLLLFDSRAEKYVSLPLRLHKTEEETHDEEDDAKSAEVSPVRDEGAPR